jgi:hypothetical protein
MHIFLHLGLINSSKSLRANKRRKGAREGQVFSRYLLSYVITFFEAPLSEIVSIRQQFLESSFIYFK